MTFWKLLWNNVRNESLFLPRDKKIKVTASLYLTIMSLYLTVHIVFSELKDIHLELNEFTIKLWF